MADAPITIITINRNTGEAARRTALSVHEQSQPCSWVMVDGASSDGSGAILRDAARPGDRFISEPDAGIADAFNKGIGMAEGRALLFLNAGDSLVGPHALRHLAEAWDGGARPWVTGGAEVRDETGRLLYVRQHRPDIPVTSLLGRGCRIWHAATLIDRGLFRTLGGYDTSYRIAMDYELWLRFAAAGHRPQVIPDLVCQFRVGGVSARVRERMAEDRRARAAHGFANSALVEAGLSAITLAKRALKPFAGQRFYRLKERLGW